MMPGSAGGVVVPVVLWGRTPPAHAITSVLVDWKDQFFVTGCRDGQICIWELFDQLKAKPKFMLFGHHGAVTSLCRASNRADRNLVVSSTDTGEMCLWDLKEMICVENTKMAQIHTSIHAYQMAHVDDFHLFCNGKYPEVLIVDPLTLKVVWKLASRFSPDWISAITVLRVPSTRQDVVVGLTVAGTVRVWTLDALKQPNPRSPEVQELQEDEAKQINTVAHTCGASWCLQSSRFNQRLMLIVNSRAWQLYDPKDFSLLCTVPSFGHLSHWIGGDFLALDQLLLWASDGHAYLYHLPPSCIPGSKNFREFVGSPLCEGAPFLLPNSSVARGGASVAGQQPANVDDAVPRLVAVLLPAAVLMKEHLPSPPAWQFCPKEEVATSSQSKFMPRGNPYHQQSDGGYQPVLIRGDAYGRVTLWILPPLTSTQIQRARATSPLLTMQTELSLRHQALSAANIVEIEPAEYLAIADAWHAIEPPPPGVLDQLNYDHSLDDMTGHPVTHHITASLYIPSTGKLVCGREDGLIIYVTATQTLFLHLLDGRHARYKDWPPYRCMTPGHEGTVTCLLHPHSEQPERYNSRHLLSGGIDFCVKLWDMEQCALLHSFCAQAGDILQLLVPPSGANNRILSCVASVAADHSVALLSIKERRCVLLASRHLFPVQQVKWRPLDDFLIVQTSDGTVFIWQMETGHLDRVVRGAVAEDIIHACDLGEGSLQWDMTAEVDDDATSTAASSTSGSKSGVGKTNATLQFVRAIRHRNLAVARQAAERGLQKLQAAGGQRKNSLATAGVGGGWSGEQKSMPPLIIQGLRTGGELLESHESHVLLFDVEGIIAELLMEDNASTAAAADTSATSAATSRTSPIPANLPQAAVAAQQQPLSASAPSKELGFGLLSKVRDRAGDVTQRIQAATTDVLQNVQDRAAVALPGAVGRRLSTSPAQQSFNADPAAATAGGGMADVHVDMSAALGESTNSLTMEIAQLLLSLLHAWGVDAHQDHFIAQKIGLLRPRRPVNYGILSRAGFMSVLMPTYPSSVDMQRAYQFAASGITATLSGAATVGAAGVGGGTGQSAAVVDWRRRASISKSIHTGLLVEEDEEAAAEESEQRRNLALLEKLSRVSASPAAAAKQPQLQPLLNLLEHWRLSSSLTTNHLVSVIAIANTLMRMNNATFVIEQEKKRKLVKRLTRAGSKSLFGPEPPAAASLSTTTSEQQQQQALPAYVKQQQQVSEGWRQLSTLHCEKLAATLGRKFFKPPHLEMLARRWQDRCTEIRESSRSLLLAELRRIGPSGRRAVVEVWAPYLPDFGGGSGVSSLSMSAAAGGGGGFDNNSSRRTSTQSVMSTAGQTPQPSGLATGASTPSSVASSSFPAVQDSRPSTRASGAASVVAPPPIAQSHHTTPSLAYAFPATSSIDAPTTAADNSGPGGASNLQEPQQHAYADVGYFGRSQQHNYSSSPSQLALQPAQDDEQQQEEFTILTAPATTYEYKRRQALAVVILGVIGAEFGQESPPTDGVAGNLYSNLSGFAAPSAAGGDYSLARATSRALSYLLLHPPDVKLPPHTALRRAAMDLIGRGFIVWEPYLDVSQVILALLRMCSDAERLLGASSSAVQAGLNMQSTTPPPLLSPAADSARSARRSLAVIAFARPPLLIIILATEVARYNALAQSAQAINVNLSNAVVVRARREILRVLSLLIDYHPSEVVKLLQETVDIVLHCVDGQEVRTRGLIDLYPPLGRFAQVSFCRESRRLAVGGAKGTIVLYELGRGSASSSAYSANKQHTQILKAHTGPITAVAFAPDAKHLASYSAQEHKLLFWHTASNLFGIGQGQAKVIKIRDGPPLNEQLVREEFQRFIAATAAVNAGALAEVVVAASGAGGAETVSAAQQESNAALRPVSYRPLARLLWKTNKEVILLVRDGTEQRYAL